MIDIGETHTRATAAATTDQNATAVSTQESVLSDAEPENLQSEKDAVNTAKQRPDTEEKEKLTTQLLSNAFDGISENSPLHKGTVFPNWETANSTVRLVSFSRYHTVVHVDRSKTLDQYMRVKSKRLQGKQDLALMKDGSAGIPFKERRYVCMNFGKPRQSHSAGLRPKQSYQGLGCKFHINVSYSPRDNEIKVTSCNLEHTAHQPTAETVSHHHSQRKLKPEDEKWVAALLMRSHVPCRELMSEVSALSSTITLKDLYNIKTKARMDKL